MRILYICTHNRCRSILAEAITRDLARERILAASAGSQPAGEVHPLSLNYLSEHGIDTTGLHSKSWDQYADFNADAIITLCNSAAQETCPVWFDETSVVHWLLADPSLETHDEQQSKMAFYDTINILQSRIKSLLALPLEELSAQQRIDALTQLAT